MFINNNELSRSCWSRRPSALADLDDRFREARTYASGQQETSTDASRVFALNVRNREANQAHPGFYRAPAHPP